MRTKFFYVRNKKQFPVACIATIEFRGRIVYDWSVWNPLDKFSKARGREVAAGRLRNYVDIVSLRLRENPTHNWEMDVNTVPIGLDVQKSILEDIVACDDNTIIPTALREGAKAKLKQFAELEKEVAEFEKEVAELVEKNENNIQPTGIPVPTTICQRDVSVGHIEVGPNGRDDNAHSEQATGSGCC